MCLSDLASHTPNRAKSLQMGPQNTCKQHLKPLVFIVHSVIYVGPTYGQIGPILSNTFGGVALDRP